MYPFKLSVEILKSWGKDWQGWMSSLHDEYPIYKMLSEISSHLMKRLHHAILEYAQVHTHRHTHELLHTHT